MHSNFNESYGENWTCDVMVGWKCLVFSWASVALFIACYEMIVGWDDIFSSFFFFLMWISWCVGCHNWLRSNLNFFFWCLLLYGYFFSCYLIIIFLGGGIVVRFSARFSFLALIPLSLDACLAFFFFFFLLDLWCHWVSKMVFHLLGFLVADPFLFPFFFPAWLVRSCISISRCHWSQAPKLLGGWSLRACGVGCVLPLVLQA